MVLELNPTHTRWLVLCLTSEHTELRAAARQTLLYRAASLVYAIRSAWHCARQASCTSSAEGPLRGGSVAVV
jgi:hypothetical protein